MKISCNMNLNDLAEHMGNAASELEAVAMRDLLVEQYDGQDICDVPETEWLLMLDQVSY